MLDSPVIRRQLVDHYRNELRRIVLLAGEQIGADAAQPYRGALEALEFAARRTYRTEAQFVAEMDRIRRELRERLSIGRSRSRS